MSSFDSCWFARLILLTLSPVFLATGGCDQVKSVVDKATPASPEPAQPAQQSQPAQASQPTPALQPPAATAEIPTPPPTPKTPPPPTPEELLADFQQLKPNEISDGALARVTSSPEAASAITKLEIQSDQVSGTGLRHLAAMENLINLTLACPNLLPEQLSVLSRVTSLTTLNLGSTKTNDEVVGNLTTLTNLEYLDIRNTPVSPAVGVPLSRFKNLQTLVLEFTAADDSTVAAISSLPIRNLYLGKTRVTNQSLAIIKGMKALESLTVAFCSVTGEGFQGYSGSGLKVLDVGETSFGIEGFMNIKGMKSLEYLNVYQCGLVEHTKANVFRTFPKLKHLNAGRNSITDAGMVVFFKGHRSLEELLLADNSKISDQGLAALIGVKTLRLLDVHSTSCTAQGGKALKAKLPDCKIITP